MLREFNGVTIKLSKSCAFNGVA